MDKPVIEAEKAQQAAAIAREAAAAANQAGQVVGALPDSSTKNTLLKVLGAVGVIGTITATALSAGTVPAIIVGVASTATYLAGLFHPSPQAISAFGASAK